MDTSKILAKAGRAMSKVGFYAKKYSPELFMILGIGTAIGGTIVACVATTKVDTVLDKTKNDLDVIHKNKETADTKELVEANRKDLIAVYGRTGWELTKLYAPAVGLLAGWRYRKDNPDGDNYIQFIVKKVKIPKSSDPEDGYEDAYLIDFNVDGNILEKMSDDDYFEC